MRVLICTVSAAFIREESVHQASLLANERLGMQRHGLNRIVPCPQNAGDPPLLLETGNTENGSLDATHGEAESGCPIGSRAEIGASSGKVEGVFQERAIGLGTRTDDCQVIAAYEIWSRFFDNGRNGDVVRIFGVLGDEYVTDAEAKPFDLRACRGGRHQAHARPHGMILIL